MNYAINQSLIQFQLKFDDLMKSVHHSSPDAVDYFFPELTKIIREFDDTLILNYGKEEASPAYIFSLFVKAGFRNIDSNFLKKILKTGGIEESYDAALCLAICDMDEGLIFIENIVKNNNSANTSSLHP